MSRVLSLKSRMLLCEVPGAQRASLTPLPIWTPHPRSAGQVLSGVTYHFIFTGFLEEEKKKQIFFNVLMSPMRQIRNQRKSTKFDQVCNGLENQASRCEREPTLGRAGQLRLLWSSVASSGLTLRRPRHDPVVRYDLGTKANSCHSGNLSVFRS